MIATAAPARPAAINWQRRPSPPARWYRGVQFIRHCAADGTHRWVMTIPVQGPGFPDMQAAARWCRQHGIQDPLWRRGMSGNPSNW